MPRNLVDYYDVLQVSRSATAEELRQAYKDQALRHHPDKNPGNVEAATEQFKLVAEAFSVLKDPGQRLSYDRRDLWTGGRFSSQSWSSSSSPDPEFSFDSAKDLFRDVFGDDVTDVLSRVAGGAVDKTRDMLARAKNSVAENSVVRSVASAGYEAVVADAQTEMEGLATQGMNHKTNALESHGRLKVHVDQCRTAEVFRREREDHARCASANSALHSIGVLLAGAVIWWFRTCLLGTSAVLQVVLAAFGGTAAVSFFVRLGLRVREVLALLERHEKDRAKEADRRVQLQREVCASKNALERWRRDSSDARLRLAHAKRDAANVHESGPSFKSVVQLGSHFAGKLVRRIASTSSNNSLLAEKIL